MRVLLLVDAEAYRARNPSFLSDTPERLASIRARRAHTERCVADALRASDHHVSVLPARSLRQIRSDLSRLRESVDVVFNLTETIRGDRTQDANIADILEQLRIPYTGNSSQVLAACRDKAQSKRVASAAAVHVPSFAVVRTRREALHAAIPSFPLIVKPLYGDASEGISLASFVTTRRQLVKRWLMIRRRYEQPAICEQFVEGRELHVTVFGHTRPRVLAIRELVIGRRVDGLRTPHFATDRVKCNHHYKQLWDVRWIDAVLSASEQSRVCSVARRCFLSLKLRDYARLDFRMAADGRIVFLEANPNSNLSPTSPTGPWYPAKTKRIREQYRLAVEFVLQNTWLRHADGAKTRGADSHLRLLKSVR